MSGRDRQRARVYAWEDRVVAPHAPDLISYSAAQPMVDAIWAEMGLRWPPKVERLPGQATARQADASRLRLRLPEALPSWILLHELAHAMTSTAEGGTDGHGPRFMGLYLQLLERYLRLPAADLLPSLQKARIEVDLGARPTFLSFAFRIGAAELCLTQSTRNSRAASARHRQVDRPLACPSGPPLSSGVG